MYCLKPACACHHHATIHPPPPLHTTAPPACLPSCAAPPACLHACHAPTHAHTLPPPTTTTCLTTTPAGHFYLLCHLPAYSTTCHLPPACRFPLPPACLPYHATCLPPAPWPSTPLHACHLHNCLLMVVCYAWWFCGWIRSVSLVDQLHTTFAPTPYLIPATQLHYSAKWTVEAEEGGMGGGVVLSL